MPTLIASILSLLLSPLTAVATTIALTKLTGRLDRLTDQQGRSGWMFAFKFGNRPWEFLVGLVRGFSVVVVVRTLASLLNPPVIWPLIASAALPMVGWEVWRLRFQARFWPVAASAGIESRKLDPQDAQRALTNALEGGQRTAGLMRAAFYGDLVGLLSGTFLLLRPFR